MSGEKENKREGERKKIGVWMGVKEHRSLSWAYGRFKFFSFFYVFSVVVWGKIRRRAFGKGAESK